MCQGFGGEGGGWCVVILIVLAAVDQVGFQSDRLLPHDALL